MLTYAVTLIGLYTFIVLVDPFDVLSLSLNLDRRPITNNQRFSFPGIARKAQFDSAVVGSSSVMLLDPEELNRDLGGRFVTLAMGRARHYEQRVLLAVFARHHPLPRTVILSIDKVWLRSDYNRRRYGYGPGSFPEWMYDESPWNDYANHLDGFSIERAGAQLAQVLGLEKAQYRADGYKRFVPTSADYDVAKVDEYLYGAAQRSKTESWQRTPPESVEFEVAAVREALALLPAATEKILVLPPAHVVAHPPLRHAKSALIAAVRDVPNVRIVDFMFPSSITTVDSNYWDTQHYTVEIARQISRLLAQSRDPAFESDVCRVLLRTGSGS